jgi:hypothetical protein
VEPDLLKASASPCAISMPGLMRVGDSFFRVWTRGSSPTPCIAMAMANGSPWVTPSLLRVTRNGVAAAIENASRTPWPCTSHGPWHQRPVALIECIAGINQQESLFLWVGAFLPKKFSAACTPTLIPASRPKHNWSTPQALSPRFHKRAAFFHSYHSTVSPTPDGRGFSSPKKELLAAG